MIDAEPWAIYRPAHNVGPNWVWTNVHGLFCGVPRTTDWTQFTILGDAPTTPGVRTGAYVPPLTQRLLAAAVETAATPAVRWRPSRGFRRGHVHRLRQAGADQLFLCLGLGQRLSWGPLQERRTAVEPTLQWLSAGRVFTSFGAVSVALDITEHVLADHEGIAALLDDVNPVADDLLPLDSGPVLDDDWFAEHGVVCTDREVLNLGEPMSIDALRAVRALCHGGG